MNEYKVKKALHLVDQDPLQIFKLALKLVMAA